MTVSDVLETCSKPGRWLLQYENHMGWRSVKDLAGFTHLVERPQLLLQGLVDQEWSLPRLAHAIWTIRKSTEPNMILRLRVVEARHWHDDRVALDIEILVGRYWRPEWESAVA